MTTSSDARASAPVHIAAGEGRSFWGPGDRYTFLTTGRETDGGCFILEAVVPPGGGPPPRGGAPGSALFGSAASSLVTHCMLFIGGIDMPCGMLGMFGICISTVTSQLPSRRGPDDAMLDWATSDAEPAVMSAMRYASFMSILLVQRRGRRQAPDTDYRKTSGARPIYSFISSVIEARVANE